MIELMLKFLCDNDLGRFKAMIRALGIDGMATLFQAFEDSLDLLRRILDEVCGGDFVKLGKFVAKIGGPLSLYSVCSNIHSSSDIIDNLRGIQDGQGLITSGNLQLVCLDQGTAESPKIVMLSRNVTNEPEAPEDPRFPGVGHRLNDEEGEGVRALIEKAEKILPEAAHFVETLGQLGLLGLGHDLWTRIEAIRRLLEQDQSTIWKHRELIDKLLTAMQTEVQEAAKITPRLLRPLGMCSTWLDTIAIKLVALDACSKTSGSIKGVSALQERQRELQTRLDKLLATDRLSTDIGKQAMEIVDAIEELKVATEKLVALAPTNQFESLLGFPEQVSRKYSELEPTIIEMLGAYDKLGFKNAAVLLLRTFNKLSVILKQPSSKILEYHEELIKDLDELGQLANQWPRLSSSLPSCISLCQSNLQVCFGKAKSVLWLCGQAKGLKIELPKGLRLTWFKDCETLQQQFHQWLDVQLIDLGQVVGEFENVNRNCIKLIEICESDFDLLNESNNSTLLELDKVIRLFESIEERHVPLCEEIKQLGLVGLANRLFGIGSKIQNKLSDTGETPFTIVELQQWSTFIQEVEGFAPIFSKGWGPVVSAIGELQEWLEALEEYLDSSRYNLAKRPQHVKEYEKLKVRLSKLETELQKIPKSSIPKDILSELAKLEEASQNLLKDIKSEGGVVQDKAKEIFKSGQSGGLPTIARNLLPRHAIIGRVSKKAIREAIKAPSGIAAISLCFQGGITNGRTGYVSGVLHWHVFGNAQNNMIFTSNMVVLGFVPGHIARENPSNVIKANKVEGRRGDGYVEVAIIGGQLYRIV